MSPSTSTKPIASAATMALIKVLVERNPRDLKLGYLTVLIIIAERKSSTIARKYFQAPNSRSFSLMWMIRSVSEATRPAADGIGNPRKSLLPPPELCALKQLNRAKRNAPHKR